MRIVDADGIDRTAALPELAGTAVRVAARSAMLDGELVVVDADGRADAAALAARLDGGPGRPAAFLAFDLLHLDGVSLLGQPLVKRREALRRILRPGDEVVAVPAIATEGRALFDAIVAQGLAGMMARQRQGPYLPGIRSRLWRFIPAAAGTIPAAELADRPAPTSHDPVRDGSRRERRPGRVGDSLEPAVRSASTTERARRAVAPSACADAGLAIAAGPCRVASGVASGPARRRRDRERAPRDGPGRWPYSSTPVA